MATTRDLSNPPYVGQDVGSLRFCGVFGLEEVSSKPEVTVLVVSVSECRASN